MWEEPNPTAPNSRSLTISLTNQGSRECEMHAPHVRAGRQEEERGSDRGVGFWEVVRKGVCCAHVASFLAEGWLSIQAGMSEYFR